jgi:hypothetical protein
MQEGSIELSRRHLVRQSRGRAWRFSGIVATLCGISFPAFGEELVPLTRQCVTDAAKAFNHDPRTLALILSAEGGRVGKYTRNANGTVDCGPAQVNSSNALWIAEALKLRRSSVMTLLRDDGCFNIKVGAWILRRSTDRVGGDLLKGMGRYNSSDPVFSDRYMRRILSKLGRLAGR